MQYEYVYSHPTHVRTVLSNVTLALILCTGSMATRQRLSSLASLRIHTDTGIEQPVDSTASTCTLKGPWHLILMHLTSPHKLFTHIYTSKYLQQNENIHVHIEEM